MRTVGVFFMIPKQYYMTQAIAVHNTTPSCLNILLVSGTPFFVTVVLSQSLLNSSNCLYPFLNVLYDCFW